MRGIYYNFPVPRNISVTKCGPPNFLGLKGTKRGPIFYPNADLMWTYSIP